MANKGANIMIIAGEASGDRLGAELVREIRRRRDSFSFFGTPGPEMRRASVESIFDSDEWSVVGIGAVLRSVPRFLRILSELGRTANLRRPDAVILIDFPEFNLKLARILKNDRHKVIYYVSPQVWAWRKYRVRTIRKHVDLLLSILPFEKEWYLKREIENVEYVGNPVVCRTIVTKTREEFCEQFGLDPENKLIALLPGSRRKEIRRHLPIMIETARRLRNEYPSLQFAVAASDSGSRLEIQKLLSTYQDLKCTVTEGDTVDLLGAAYAAAISSGTATLEAGIVGTPMIVVYKVPKLDQHVLRMILSVPHYALLNLIAGKAVATELIQNEFTAEKLTAEFRKLLDPEENSRVRDELLQVALSLDSENSSVRAAESVLRFVDSLPPRP